MDIVSEEFRFKQKLNVPPDKSKNTSKNKSNNTNSTSTILDLRSSLIHGNVLESNTAMVEMLCNQQYDQIWNTVFEVYIMYINLKHINLLPYLINKWTYFLQLAKKNNTALNNSQEIRNLLAQVITILALEPKHKLDIRTHNKILRTSDMTIKAVNQYMNMAKPFVKSQSHSVNKDCSDDLQIILLNIFEFYTHGNNKSTFDHLKYLLKLPCEITPVIKCNKKSLQKLPVMIVWRYLLDQDQTNFGKLFFKIFCLVEPEYYIYVIYNYVSYMVQKDKLEYKAVNIHFKEVLRQVLQINFTCLHIINHSNSA